MGDVIHHSFSFGCIETETKLFLDQKANGIMGFAPSEKSYIANSHAFSICLYSHGGDLEIFDTNNPPLQGGQIALEYTQGHYVVSPVSAQIDDITMDINGLFGNQVLIDSGSTITYFHKPFFDAVLRVIKERIGTAFTAETSESKKPTLCWNGTGDFFQFLPVLKFVFSGVQSEGVPITFSKYAYADPTEPGKHCLLIASNEGLKRTDLGASFMIGKLMTFSVSDGWLGIEENGNCTQREFKQRPNVIPVEGQLTIHLSPPKTQSDMVLYILIFLMIVTAMGVGSIVRKSVSYSPLQDDGGIELANTAASDSPRRRRGNSAQLE